MPLPSFREDGWLPDGHYEAEWEEIALRFGGAAGGRRAEILENLLCWRDQLRQKGITGRRGRGIAVITNGEQLEVALRQLAGFRDMLEAMRLHLTDSEPSLIPTVSASYEQRIRALQGEICDYLLRQREHAELAPLTAAPA